MLNSLLQLDTQFFLLINHLPHNFIFDSFFGILSIVGEYGIIWFILATIIFVKNYARPPKATQLLAGEGKKLLTIYAVGFLSLILIFILKRIFGRLRPEFSLHDVISPFPIDNSSSFPSGHALMSFVFAYVLGKLGKLGQLWLYLLAVLIAFSRIYLGQHYPSDVLAGAILGLIIGFVSIGLVSHFRSTLNQNFPRIFI